MNEHSQFKRRIMFLGTIAYLIFFGLSFSSCGIEKRKVSEYFFVPQVWHSNALIREKMTNMTKIEVDTAYIFRVIGPKKNWDFEMTFWDSGVGIMESKDIQLIQPFVWRSPSSSRLLLEVFGPAGNDYDYKNYELKFIGDQFQVIKGPSGRSPTNTEILFTTSEKSNGKFLGFEADILNSAK